jgi:hypothetical protein
MIQCPQCRTSNALDVEIELKQSPRVVEASILRPTLETRSSSGVVYVDPSDFEFGIVSMHCSNSACTWHDGVDTSHWDVESA